MSFLRIYSTSPANNAYYRMWTWLLNISVSEKKKNIIPEQRVTGQLAFYQQVPIYDLSLKFVAFVCLTKSRILYFSTDKC